MRHNSSGPGRKLPPATAQPIGGDGVRAADLAGGHRASARGMHPDGVRAAIAGRATPAELAEAAARAAVDASGPGADFGGL
jgi:hypothetical protein